MKKAVIVLSLLLAISAALNIIYIRARIRCGGGAARNLRPDTVRIIDTLRFISPAPTRDTIIRYVRVPVEQPRQDNPDDTGSQASTGNQAEYAEKAPGDTAAALILPITQRTYSTPEYTAYVSGYLPSLDSISVYAPRTVITQPPPEAKGKPWSIGIAAGVGAGRGGLTPFVGITLQYSLIRF